MMIHFHIKPCHMKDFRESTDQCKTAVLVFRCGYACLQEGLSVRPSVGLSVRRCHDHFCHMCSSSILMSHRHFKALRHFHEAPSGYHRISGYSGVNSSISLTLCRSAIQSVDWSHWHEPMLFGEAKASSFRPYHANYSPLGRTKRTAHGSNQVGCFSSLQSYQISDVTVERGLNSGI